MKIKSVKLLGRTETYSPEMADPHHNYMLSGSKAVHMNSHGIAYCLLAHRCFWLKRHFAPEFWAAVMSDCHPDKLAKFMGIARSEKWSPTHITYSGLEIPKDIKGIVFDTINIENLTTNFTVSGNTINQGLIGIKGIGESAAEKFSGQGKYSDIDDFIDRNTKSKTVLERFIKLGAFKHLHPNSYALWQWYQYKYCSGKNITQLKKEVKEALLLKEGWNDSTIDDEIKRQSEEFRKIYPNRKKLPDKIKNWKPKPDDSRDKVMALFSDRDFGLEEVLEFEKQYLGYYLHSPLDLYDIDGQSTIDDAKKISNNGGDAKLEVIVTDIQFQMSKNDKEYARLFVSDGMQDALVLIFNNELRRQDACNLVPGTGIQMWVDYDDKRGTFTLKRNEVIVKLLPVNWKSN